MNSIFKITLQLSISIALFFVLYLGLKQIDFIGNLQIDKFTKENENKLREFIYEYIHFESDEVADDTLHNTIW